MTDNIAKAREAKINKARNAIWIQVVDHAKATGCSCVLDREDTLATLTADRDCCAPINGGHGRYVCPTLDKYRRLLGAPVAHADETNGTANFYPPKFAVI